MVSQLDLSGNQLCGKDHLGFGTHTAEGITAIADTMRINGSLTKLSLAQNWLGEEGTKAICEALEQNTTLKELGISSSCVFIRKSNIGGTAGGKHVAKMLGVNGGLTALDLSHNCLEDEGVSAVCKAIQNNKDTKLASLNFKNNGIGPVGANAVAAMVAVTGGLTSINLSDNRLCGVWTDFRGGQQGTYTAEGFTAIADAMRDNGALTQVLAF
jgi:Ran GTPase-activating protein (RanGAP) involved in mRNA processing and transport